jgi:hypothetical protein
MLQACGKLQYVHSARAHVLCLCTLLVSAYLIVCLLSDRKYLENHRREQSCMYTALKRRASLMPV